ncbi:VOC family protein [Mariniluteicoccus flavus]
MALQLAPYVHFPNNDCAAAFAFYGSVFDAQPTILRGSDMQAEGMDPNMVMHAELKLGDGATLYGSDDCMGQKIKPQGFEACIFTDDEEQGRRWFAGLSEGAEIHLPIDTKEWGDVYGQLTDRFGLTWAINVNQR